MRIFITGSTGFLGRNLARVLLNHDLYLYKRDENIEEAVDSFKPQIIYHLAAETANEEKMFESNVMLTQRLVDACRPLDYMAFICVGSSSEYGIKDGPMRESDECEPTTLYGKTKLLATQYCQFEAQTADKNIMVLRPFSPYGDEESPSRLIPRLIDSCLSNRHVDLYEGNHDFIHVSDVVIALLSFAYKILPGEVINIGTGIQTSNLEVLKMVEKLTGQRANVTMYNEMYKKTDSKIWVADIEKALTFGWKPAVTLEEGLRRAINEARGTGESH